MDYNTLFKKYMKTQSWHYQPEVAPLLGKTYEECMEYKRRAGDVDCAAGWAMCAHIGVSLGATNFHQGVAPWTISRLANTGKAWDNSLFDHTVTFKNKRTLIGILTRPYKQNDDLMIRDFPSLAVWKQPKEMCSWCPPSTQSYLLTSREQPSPGLGFERL